MEPKNLPEQLNEKTVTFPEGLNALSVVIPARNEADALQPTLEHLHLELNLKEIRHEIIVVDDGSTDETWMVLQAMRTRIPTLRPLRRTGEGGFGRAVTTGLQAVAGDAVVIMMADESDDVRDVVKYWELLGEGWECVFGSRFIRGGAAVDYPPFKWILNRLANLFIKIVFRIPLNDTTNAFKAYRTDVIRGCEPLISPHFNLTVELTLKAIVRGYTWTVTPITWRNRRSGESKLRIRELGSRYLFICAYVWLEKYFSRGDYMRLTDRKKVPPHSSR